VRALRFGVVKMEQNTTVILPIASVVMGERLGVLRRQVRRYMDAGYLDWGICPSGRRMLPVESVDRFIQRALEGKLSR